MRDFDPTLAPDFRTRLRDRAALLVAKLGAGGLALAEMNGAATALQPEVREEMELNLLAAQTVVDVNAERVAAQRAQ